MHVKIDKIFLKELKYFKNSKNGTLCFVHISLKNYNHE